MKYALVTGGSRGIGKAIAIKLASQGWSVIINYKSDRESAENTLREIVAEGGSGELLQFDVSNPSETEKALDSWIKSHPDDYIAVLVNNAGIRQDNLIVFMEDEQWHNVIDTTLNGFFYITRKLVKYMVSKRWGRVINMASLSGIKGMPGQTNYSAAKSALIGATKALAQEVAGRKVTVNAVAPGFIESDMTKDLNVDELKKLVPMGRFGKAEEVAALVAFLVSSEASYITGDTISINGGLYT